MSATAVRTPTALRHRQSGALLVADAIEAIHRPLELGEPMCADCLQPYPCRTVSAAREAVAKA